MDSTNGLKHSRKAAWLVAAVCILIWTSPAIAGPGDCSQPMSAGADPVATDCLYILRTSVALESCAPGCICAPKGSLPTTATDSLTCLKYSVGQPVALDCPCVASTTSSTTTTTTTTSSTTTTTAGPTTSTTTSTTTTSTTTSSTTTTTLVGPTTTTLAGPTTTTLWVTTTTLYDPFACGNVLGAPQCFGVCPTGEACLHTGTFCYCGPSTTPCESANDNKCNGTCAAGSYCDRSGDACICVTP